MTIANDFDQLERVFARLNRRNRPSRVFRDSLRKNNRLRQISRSGPLGRAGLNSASILGSALVEQLFSDGGFVGGTAGQAGINQTPPFNGGIGSGNTATGLGDIFSQSSVQFGLASVFATLFEGLIGEALSSTRTRTSVSETERSQEASQRWNTSRSQADAELASIVNRGLGQL